MRVRNINFWQQKIFKEISKPVDKRFKKFFLPKNIEEELNYEIALYFIFFRNKNNHSNKLVA